MKIGKKIFVGIYVCLFVFTITLSGVIIVFSALNSDFSTPFEIYYYVKPEILSDDYGYYVEMGEYPQTFAGYVDSDGDDIDDMDYTLTGEDFIYVAKGGTTATADVYTDSEGNRYIRYTVAAYSTSYTFMDGTSTASGAAYFKLEPIKWRILGYYEDSAHTNGVTDTDSSFVQLTSVSDENYNALASHSDAIVAQSELALECVQWNTSNSDVDYTGSTIYNWLNNFYSEILSGYDSYISSRTIDYNDTSATSSGQTDTAALTTSEKVWLISYTEANGVFYSSSTLRLCSPSDFGLATYIYMNTGYTSNYRTETCNWWLRSSFLDSNYFAHGVSYGGFSTYGVFISDSRAVRPALLLNLSSTDTNATATGVSSIAESGSTRSINVLLITVSFLDEQRLVLCLENYGSKASSKKLTGNNL